MVSFNHHVNIHPRKIDYLCVAVGFEQIVPVSLPIHLFSKCTHLLSGLLYHTAEQTEKY